MHSCKLATFLVLSRGQGTNMFLVSLAHFTDVILSKYSQLSRLILFVFQLISTKQKSFCDLHI